MKRSYALMGFLLVLCGCTSLGITPAKSFTEKLAYAYGTNAGLRTAATTSLTAGAISSEDAEYVLGVTDQTRALLGAAQLASRSGDVATADGRLTLAITVLEQLQQYLSKKVAP